MNIQNLISIARRMVGYLYQLLIYVNGQHSKLLGGSYTVVQLPQHHYLLK